MTAIAAPLVTDQERRGRYLGWAGVVIAIIAALLTLPPFEVRTVLPSAVLVAASLACGLAAVRSGVKRVGWGAVVASVVCLVLAILATRARVDSLEVVVTWSALLAATLRYATPLLFAGLGGLVSERAGVVNIGLEGMMLMGAFFAAWGADVTGSWLLGTLIGVLSGMALAAIHAFFCINLRADQIVAGFALNFVALGLTGYLYIDIYGDQGTPDDLPAVPNVNLPTEDLGFIGKALSNQNLLVWGALRGARDRLARRVPDAGRPAAAVRRREPAGGRDRRDQRPADAVGRGARLRRARGARRRVPVHRLRPLVHAEHDRRQGLHRARRHDLRALEAARACSSRRCCSASAVRSPSGCRSSRHPPRRSSRRCRTC